MDDELKQLGLSEKRIRFLQHLAAGESVETAYMNAFSTKKQSTASANGYKMRKELLAKPEIKDWLDKHYAGRETENRLLLTIDQRKEVLAKIIMHGKPMEKIKALDIYNKMEAVYERRTKVEGDVALTFGWAGEDDS
ncbi:hypothetical protein [Acidaminococcus massiliensis]|uniref:hypothetical protein n=1 Tax=Acidaminococcus massiliensis TaxID=1852375 RepID=UPI0022E85A3E|nr:hypothetical protein [Acidaminococcus massiliensis]